jgi:hypothetical protein
VNDPRCPEHGNTLIHAGDQYSWLGEHEWREHLECCIKNCRYEVWA